MPVVGGHAGITILPLFSQVIHSLSKVDVYRELFSLEE